MPISVLNFSRVAETQRELVVRSNPDGGPRNS